MKAKEYLKPRPHIIISDVFDDATVKSFLDEAVSLNSSLVQGQMAHHKTKESILDRKRKNVHDLNMDNHYTERSKSKILTSLDKFLWDKEMSQLYVDARSPIFNTLEYTRNDQTHLIVYGNSEFYDWHTDMYKPPLGFTTISYMIGVGKPKFKGGDFQIKYKDEVKTIPFKRNTMIIFSRNTQHKVTSIKLDSKDPKDFRYTVQHWAY